MDVPSTLTAAWLLAAAVVLGGLLTAVVLRKARRDLDELRSGRRRAALRGGATDAELLDAVARGRAAQEDVIAALHAGGPRSVPGVAALLLEQAADGRAPARGRAAVLLALLGGDAAVLPLGVLLADRDADVRLAAANGLETLAAPTAAQTLLQAATVGRLPRARAVERLAHPWAVPALLAAHPGADPATRVVIAQALGLAGDPAAVPALRMALRATTAEERIQAARALGQLEAVTALADLTGALADEEWEVRAQVATALGRLGDPRAVEALVDAATDRAWWVRANAATALGALGAPGRTALQRLATGEDRYAAERATEVLEAAPAPAGRQERAA